MKLILVMLMLSTSAFATTAVRPELCYSTGECQSTHSVEQGIRCLKVKTGLNADGSPACAIRCSPILIGNTCEMIPGKIFGVCTQEKFNNDNDVTDCSNAVEPGDL